MIRSTAWRAQALRLRVENPGMSYADIGAIVGRHATTVGDYLLGELGGAPAKRGRARDPVPKKQRACTKFHNDQHRTKSAGMLGAGTDAMFTARHVPRAPGKIINRAAVSEAAKAFARGEITRAELMFRITPEKVS